MGLTFNDDMEADTEHIEETGSAGKVNEVVGFIFPTELLM